jgi:threonine/homoserine/homoserine lactone efflux protein
VTRALAVLSPVMAGLGIGIALAGAPGPVQAVLLTEAVRGGIARGFRALAGVHITFGLVLMCLALGLSVATPSGPVLRILEMAGGALLLWLAVEGVRSGSAATKGRVGGPARSPVARGALAILLNPGGWLFLGAVASPLFATATAQGGTRRALFVALGLVSGAAVGDCAVVLLGAIGVRRAGARIERLVFRALAVVLAGLGVWLMIEGVMA